MSEESQNVNTFTWPVRVYYEDTDSGGVVYYANYLKYMERARSELIRALGFEQDELIAQDNVIFAVRSVEIEYHLPAKFNDSLLVCTELLELGKASFVFRQIIRRQQEQKVLCQAKVKIASLDAGSFKPKAMPVALYKLLNSKKGMEGSVD